MDPALRELIAEGQDDDEVAVVVRLHDKATTIPRALRIVARFGTVVTGRARRGALTALHADPAIASLKAPRLYSAELHIVHEESEADPPRPTDRLRPEGLRETGRGTVVCVLDWGLDFAHPDFRKPDGSTRLLALWDQRARRTSVAPYGYGHVHDRAAIDRALAASDPFAALHYRPDQRAHGTHVTGIAAGNGRAGGPSGVAPEAELVFVHLSGGGQDDLGSSIELLEGIDFAVRTAGERPLVINMSLGRHAGPHDGTLLVERAIDALLIERPGTAVIQSAGNYFAKRAHMSGQLSEGHKALLPLTRARADGQPTQVEIWYKGADVLGASVAGPQGIAGVAALGSDASLRVGGREVGKLYHRRNDPNNGDNLVELVLRREAPTGDYTIELEGIDTVDGRWFAWIERDTLCNACQAQFPADLVSTKSTTGSVCNAMRSIAVGAYDAHDPAHPIPPFSSSGPTRDGRRKPLLSAPGFRVLSVRSRDDVHDAPGYIQMSGTSMAAPSVTGTLALMFEAAGRQRISLMRRTLFTTLDRVEGDEDRRGYGLLDINAAVAAARSLRRPSEAEPIALPIPPALAMPALIDPRTALARAVDPSDPALQVVASPGQRPLDMPRGGDLMLRQGLGGAPRLMRLADGTLLDSRDLARRGIFGENQLPGRFVEIDDGSGIAGFARRLIAPDGLTVADTWLLRPAGPGFPLRTEALGTRAADTDPPDPPQPRPGPPIVPIAASGVYPVLVLPGVMGTRLEFPQSPGLPHWDPDSAWQMGRWIFLDPDVKLHGLDMARPATIIADSRNADEHRRGWDQIPQRIYRDLLLAIDNEFNRPQQHPGLPRLRCPAWAMGYDWRQSNARHAQHLVDTIDRILESEIGSQQVIVVTHSMGGLVLRSALRQFGERLSRKIRGVIHTVQPAVGAVVAARRCRTGFARNIDGQLGEMLAAIEAGVLERIPTPSDNDDESIGKFLQTMLFHALFSDSRFGPSPRYYQLLMAVLSAPNELLPSDAGGRAWWPHAQGRRESLHDLYGMPGGLIHADHAGTPVGGLLRARFAEAGAFHRTIEQLYHPRTGVLFSTGLTTDVALDPERRPKEGDGTVPAFSGRCPDLATPVFRHGFNKVEHGGCFDDREFREAVLDGIAYIAGNGSPLGDRRPLPRSVLAGIPA